MSAWSPLPRRRLAQGPASGMMHVWLSRGAAALVVVAMAWVIVAALRPLPGTPVVEAPTPEALPPISFPASPLEQRQSQIAALSDINLFDATGSQWIIAQALLPEEASEPRQPELTEEPQERALVIAESESAPVIAVTRERDLPDDVRQARQNIRVFGIRSMRDGSMLAMLQFRASESRDGTFREFRAGDVFTDPKFAREKWLVYHIDAFANVVYLRRSGATVALPLHAEVALAMPVREPPPGNVLPTVERATPEDVAARLRAAGIDEARIAEVVALMDDPDAARPAQQPAPSAPSSVIVEEAQEEDPTDRLSEIFKLMADVEKRSQEQAGATEEDDE
ncbi:MAG: hypothetical protein AAFX05_08100 [Planctomycetota bacterium]